MGGGPMDDISDSWVHVDVELESPTSQESIVQTENPETEEPLSSVSSVSQPHSALLSPEGVEVPGVEIEDRLPSGNSRERGIYSSDNMRTPDVIHSLKLKLQAKTAAAPKWKNMLLAMQQVTS